MKPQTFRQLLEAHYAHFDSFADAAEPVGITGSRYARAMKGEYSFDVATCLKFAGAAGVDPGLVLRAAGKPDVADMLDALYGRVAAPAVPAAALEDAARLSRLPLEQRKALRVVLAGLVP